jgi:DNA gyrase subunit A
LYLIRQDVGELKRKYGDARRTHIVGEADASLSAQDLVPDVRVLISVTQRGYIKRTPAKAYRLNRKQKQHMVGVPGMETREQDAVRYIFAAGSRDDVLFFTNQGKVYQEKVYQIPERDRAAMGIPLINLVRLQTDERVTAVLPVSDFQEDAYLTMFTMKGKVKRVPLSEFSTVRASGLLAFRLDEGDALGWVCLTDGTKELVVTTAEGKALRFAETQVRPQGREATGMLGIKLAKGDVVADADVVEKEGQVLLVTQNGFGRCTGLEEYPTKGRNTGGVITLHPKYRDLTGPVVAALVVQPQDQVAFITASGRVLPVQVSEIPQSARTTRGQIIMNVYKGDRLSAVARLMGQENEGEQE